MIDKGGDMGWLADETGLEKCRANHVPLTPLSFLARAADIFATREALAYGATRRSYAEYRDRVSRLASGLAGLGVRPGDVVATILPNVPPHAEAHFGVPACGAVLNAINTRLDVDTVRYILEHGGAKVVLVDSAFLDLAEAAIAGRDNPPLLIEWPDAEAGIAPSGRHRTYEDLLAAGDPAFAWVMPQDEWESLALNYTSGTTGRPKGVVYHHRGAYLAAMGQVISWRIVLYPRYLTIVPMFHCNAWCHPWMLPLLGGTMICLRDITARGIYHAIACEKATHFGGAPIVLNTIINARPEDRLQFDMRSRFSPPARPPPPRRWPRSSRWGFNVTQVYGLTETYGPATECTWNDDFDTLPPDDRAAVKARTGVAMPFMEEVTVTSPRPDAHTPRRRKPGRDHASRQRRDEGLLSQPRGHARRLRGGVFPFRRHRLSPPRRLHQDRRPSQGHHHLGRREREFRRGGGRPDAAPRRAARSRGRPARRQMGRGPLRLPRTEGGRDGRAVRDHRLLPCATGRLQDAQDGRRLRTAQDLDRQDPEVRPAREGARAGPGCRLPPRCPCIPALPCDFSPNRRAVHVRAVYALCTPVPKGTSGTPLPIPPGPSLTPRPAPAPQRALGSSPRPAAGVTCTERAGRKRAKTGARQ
jgi:acyl-CoA synthetase (AMP-forming)/AMP-acid ligase II